MPTPCPCSLLHWTEQWAAAVGLDPVWCQSNYNIWGWCWHVLVLPGRPKYSNFTFLLWGRGCPSHSHDMTIFCVTTDAGSGLLVVFASLWRTAGFLLEVFQTHLLGREFRFSSQCQGHRFLQKPYIAWCVRVCNIYIYIHICMHRYPAVYTICVFSYPCRTPLLGRFLRGVSNLKKQLTNLCGGPLR